MFSRKRIIPTFITVIALALLLGACGGGSKDTPATSNQPATSQPAATQTAAESGPREIRIVLDDFTFEPQDITVKSGERVRLVLVNEGSVAHDWHVDSLNLSSPLVQAGQTATFEFTAGAAGQYDAYCAEPGHEVLGMVGTITIE